jgi:hypothetical protein
MGTATSSRAILGLAALALAASGCTTEAGMPASSAATISHARIVSAQAAAGGFAWLRPNPAPAGWRLARIASGAVMPYPPGWQRVAGDAGTATAVLQGAHHDYLGYLNLTPRQGDETLRSWASFRVEHNVAEGDRAVRTLASASGLRFRSGRGSCVQDSYTTSSGARFVELACLAAGRNVTSVIVGAAPPREWVRMSPLIELAISAFTT